MYGDYREIGEIKRLLEDNPEGLSITEISQAMGVHRTTIAKYLDILQMKGDVALKIRGTSKMYQLSKRVPASVIRYLYKCPFILIGQNLTIIEISDDLAGILNIREDIIGSSVTSQSMASLMNGEIQKKCREALSGKPSAFTHSAIIRNDQKHFKIQVIPIVFDDGKTGCSILIKDFTDTRILSFNLEICENELKTLTHDLNEFVFRCTPEGILTRVNPGFCLRMGKNAEDLLGFPYEHVISHQDMESLIRKKQEISPSSPVRTIKFKVIQPDGMVAWEEWTYRGLYSKEKTITGYVAVGRDITEEQHLKEQLETFHASFEALVKQRTREMRQANQELMAEISRRELIERELLIIQAAFDHASDSIILFERSGAVWRANETSCRLLGYTKEEMKDISVFLINPNVSEGIWNNMWEQAEKDLKITRVKAFHKRKDGIIIPVDVSRTFIQAGSVTLFCSIARETKGSRSKKTTQF